MKSLVAFAFGCAVAGIGIGTRVNSIVRHVREHVERETRNEVINEAVRMGNAQWSRSDVRGYKWIVRKHSSQRSEYPNEEFVENDIDNAMANR